MLRLSRLLMAGLTLSAVGLSVSLPFKDFGNAVHAEEAGGEVSRTTSDAQQSAAEAATSPAEHAARSEPRDYAQEIDQLVEEQSVGPLAPSCSDAEFVRRIYLDLTGVIPTAGQTRQFLNDQHPDRRTILIDQLLGSEAFVRHMAWQLNVMLLERRSDKHIPEPDWERYLLTSLAESMPLDQLFRDLIQPGVRGAKSSPAAKFLLNRDAEPNAMTRDIGRMAFGVDLQCAQCHDHPLIGDYYQRDYYGLFAFVQRTSLLADAAKKKVHLSEKAEGDAGFKSVFTGVGEESTLPRLPKGRSVLIEPISAASEKYLVAPAKTTPGVPRYSRRTTLAEMLSDHWLFQRNLANRCWAMMMGRGIIHPLDLYHSANPPANPKLLDLLSREMKAGSFDLRNFLRNIARTRVYQRSSAFPQPETLNYADVAARSERLTRDLEQLTQEITPLKDAVAAAEAQWNAAVESQKTPRATWSDLRQKVADARVQSENSRTAADKEGATVSLRREQLQILTAALEEQQSAVAQLSGETVLSEAVAVLVKHVEAAQKSMAAAEAQHRKASEKLAGHSAALQALEQKFQEAVAQLMPESELQQLEQNMIDVDRRLRFREAQAASLQSQLALCEKISEFGSVRSTDPEVAAAVWRTLVNQWTINGQLSPLRPLTPEQMTVSMMRAAGVAGVPDENGASAQKGERAADPVSVRTTEEAAQLAGRQAKVINQLRDPVRQFVSAYGGVPGGEFQATVNQALFFGNGPLIGSWLKPGGDNLAARLQTLTDPADFADELYISVLNRPAEMREVQEIRVLLKEFEKDRAPIVSELIWALLSGTEFRFNH